MPPPHMCANRLLICGSAEVALELLAAGADVTLPDAQVSSLRQFCPKLYSSTAFQAKNPALLGRGALDASKRSAAQLISEQSLCAAMSQLATPPSFSSLQATLPPHYVVPHTMVTSVTSPPNA